MAVDFGKHVRVNMIQPAAIATDMLLAGFKNDPQKLKELQDYHPSGFIGKPIDIAHLALFLCQQESKFIKF